MPKETYYFIAMLAGLAVTTQAGVNAQLNLVTKNPTITAFISFLMGTLGLLAFVLIANYNSIPSTTTIVQTPWWKYTGGFLGALYITSVVLVAPKIGAANTIGFLVAGQLIFAVIFDHFGLVGFSVKSISLSRLAGIILLIAGVYLIRK